MKPSSQTSKKAKPRILVVEDEKALNQMYRSWLEHSDFEVITAEDGLEGLNSVMHDEPDLVLLDVMLPKKDGFEVLDEIRRNPKTRKLPVIVLSSLDRDFEQRRGLRLGAERYLVKTTISPDVLLEAINTCLMSS